MCGYENEALDCAPRNRSSSIRDGRCRISIEALRPEEQEEPESRSRVELAEQSLERAVQMNSQRDDDDEADGVKGGKTPAAEQRNAISSVHDPDQGRSTVRRAESSASARTARRAS